MTINSHRLCFVPFSMTGDPALFIRAGVRVQSLAGDQMGSLKKDKFVFDKTNVFVSPFLSMKKRSRPVRWKQIVSEAYYSVRHSVRGKLTKQFLMMSGAGVSVCWICPRGCRILYLQTIDRTTTSQYLDPTRW